MRSKKCGKLAIADFPVYAETCPQYLYLSLENMDAPGFRSREVCFHPAIAGEVASGKIMDRAGRRSHPIICRSSQPIIAPYLPRNKRNAATDDFTKIPNGGPGIEHRMSLIYSGGVAAGRFSVNRFVELVSTTPAKLFGLYPRKGTIAIGSDADLVYLRSQSQTHHQREDPSHACRLLDVRRN